MSQWQLGRLHGYAFCRALFIVCLTLTCLRVPLCTAQEVSAAFLLDGYRVEREKLRSGRFEIQGTTVEAKDTGESVAFTQRVVVVMDQAPAFFYTDSINTDNASYPNPDHSPIRRVVAFGDDMHAFHFSPRARTEIFPPSVVSPDTLKGVKSILDVRALGNPRLTDEFAGKTVEFYAAELEKNQWEQVTHADNGLYRLARKIPAGDDAVEWELLWIDTDKGFTPVRSQRKLVEKDYVLKDELQEPAVERQTKWVKLDDVWVPQYYRKVSRVFEEPEGGTSERPQLRTIDREWHINPFDINKVTVADALVQPVRWNVEEGTVVFDYRSGNAILLDVKGTHAELAQERGVLKMTRLIGSVVVLALLGGLGFWFVKLNRNKSR